MATMLDLAALRRRSRPADDERVRRFCAYALAARPAHERLRVVFPHYRREVLFADLTILPPASESAGPVMAGTSPTPAPSASAAAALPIAS